MGHMKFSYRRPDWRSYQHHLKKKNARKNRMRKTGFYSLFFTFLAFSVYGISGKNLDSAVSDPGTRAASSPAPFQKNPPQTPQENRKTVRAVSRLPAENSQIISKSEIISLVDSDIFLNIKEKRFPYHFDGHRFLLDTSIDSHLQNFILNHLDRENARYIGVVVMDPDTGRVLSMAGYDSNDSGKNTCTDALFPAASIFKIITAAAAVEECGFRSDSTLFLRGGRYTLYRSQLKKEAQGRPVSLRDSFAQSINPVFGKLGIHFLGKKHLESQALAFGFNRPIRFEIPVERSVIRLSDDPFHLAEIASGFNRSTAISPLHGALIVSSIAANQGRLPEPAIIDRLSDEKGRVLYRSRPRYLQRAVNPETSGIIKKMMQETIRSGTCRKIFRNHEKHPVLSRLHMGGKTGSIGSRNHENRRYDWFVGFAEEKEGGRKIAVSIVVTHEKYIGIKAGQYARMIMEEYFRTAFSGNAAEKPQTGDRTENRKTHT